MMRNSLIAVIIVLIIPVILNAINPGIFDVKINIPIVKVASPRYPFKAKPGFLPGTGEVVGCESLGAIKEQIEKEACGKNPNDISPPYSRYGYCQSTSTLYKLMESANALGKIKDLEEKNDYTEKEKLLRIIREICILESGANPEKLSFSDRCLDRKPFSVGLFQINMAKHIFTFTKTEKVAHGTGPFYYEKEEEVKIECNPHEIFFFDVVDGIKINEIKLINDKYNCRVKNDYLYNRCLEYLKNPFNNIKLASEISNGWNNLNHWTMYKCGLRKCLDRVKKGL